MLKMVSSYESFYILIASQIIDSAIAMDDFLSFNMASSLKEVGGIKILNLGGRGRGSSFGMWVGGIRVGESHLVSWDLASNDLKPFTIFMKKAQGPEITAAIILISIFYTFIAFLFYLFLRTFGIHRVVRILSIISVLNRSNHQHLLFFFSLLDSRLSGNVL